MKKLLLLFVLLLGMSTTSAFAQKYYRITTDNVNMRKGPGTNFRKGAAEPGRQGAGTNVYLFNKGQIVMDGGKKRNGFVYVITFYDDTEGWVSEKFLAPAEKCKTCNGKGTTGRVCPECNGEGFYVCCQYTGKEPCPDCGIVGYK